MRKGFKYCLISWIIHCLLSGVLGSGDSITITQISHFWCTAHNKYVNASVLNTNQEWGFNQKKIIIQKSDFHCTEQCGEYYCASPEYVYEYSKTAFIRIFFSLFFPSPYQHLQCCMIFLIALKISILHERNGPNSLK